MKHQSLCTMSGSGHENGTPRGKFGVAPWTRLLHAMTVLGVCATVASSSSAEVTIDGSAEIDATKSYWIPAPEIIGFDFLLNQFNRHREGPGD